MFGTTGGIAFQYSQALFLLNYLSLIYLFFSVYVGKVRIYKCNFLPERSLPFKCQLLYIKAQLEKSTYW